MVCLKHDNTRPHAARHTIKDSGFCKTGGFTPPAIFIRLGTQRFSPLFVLKNAFCGHHFRSDDDYKRSSITVWHSSQKISPKEFVP